MLRFQVRMNGGFVRTERYREKQRKAHFSFAFLSFFCNFVAQIENICF